MMNKKQIVDYYDQTEIDYRLVWYLNSQMAMHYGFWDKTTQNFQQALQRENEILSQIAKIKKSDLVLDAGCGVGGSAIFLAKKYGCRVFGITLVPKQVKEARENSKKHQVDHLTKFKVVDFTKTSFANESFGVVWAIESVCHAQDKQKFTQESFRVLKKEGRLIIADWFLTKERHSVYEKSLMDKWLKGWGVGFLQSAATFKQFLAEAGFKKIKFKDVTKNILPSSKRLYLYFFPGLVVTKVMEALGLRNKIQTANVMSAYYQYKLLQRNLWQYGIFYAQKGT